MEYLTNGSEIDKGLYPVVLYQFIKQCSSLGHYINVADLEKALEPYCPELKKDSLKKTIKRNLQTLIRFDEKICVEYADNSNPSFGTIEYIYYDQDLSTTDVQILSDALIYSRHLSKENKKEIYEKLLCVSGLSSKSGNTWVDSVLKEIEEVPSFESNILYRNLWLINEAIQNKECIKFAYDYNLTNNKRVAVRKYKGVSPYKIVLEDGAYYLVGSTLHTQENLDIYIEKGLAFPVVYLDIHKLSALSIDDKYEYIEVDKTTAEEWNHQQYVNAGFNPFNRQLNYREYETNPSLKVSAKGLDVLYDLFGDRVYAVSTKEKCEHYAGRLPELSYYYKASLRHFTSKDMFSLLKLLMKYPTKDIQLLNYKRTLEHIQDVVKKQADGVEDKDSFGQMKN